MDCFSECEFVVSKVISILKQPLSLSYNVSKNRLLSSTMESSTSANVSIDVDLTSEPIPVIRIVLGVILYILVVITVLGNLLVLLAVYKDKRLQTVFNYYIVNLAITDVLVALTAMSLYTTDNILGHWPLGEFMCGLWIFFDYGMTFASVFTLVVISVDRFWSVQWSIHYRHHHNKRKTMVLIGLIWLFMLILWLPPCITDRIANSEPGVCKWEPSENRAFVIVIATVGHHGACFIQIFCFLKVFMFMKKRAKLGPISKGITSSKPKPSVLEDTPTPEHPFCSIQQSSHDCDNPIPAVETATSAQPSTSLHPPKQVPSKKSDHSSTDKRERKVFVTLTYIIVGYMICWVPFHVVFDISAYDPKVVPEIIYTITFWMTYLNSTINPFLYNFSSPDFRRAFKKILTCK
ncbi:muscarinic acetylcholine receptor M2-like [Haliotis rubra]|uniref:muscarinic acetylcholine receptor M2-like n=1 Tax=Haliotis rubra TaxID=36100 RepID=UPI001EE54C9C|nr:muscarinic acetylcholine receptor M2-like [Haliotis rubra]